MDNGFRYWAFLSYSHADRRAAERLHRALEGYRIPPRLVGQAGPLGPVPKRLQPVFRDRDELTASGHIGEVVEAALAASRSLIVLCSPDAAKSRWVDAEIKEFQRLHPTAPVLCVLLGGEPMAARDPATAAQECLPPTLRARFGAGTGIHDNAPVAVDLRPDGDGWRLGVQKLVAGLAGVPLDQLVQRDAHRRHVRMAWLTAALATIAIALGALSIVALRARDEARAQRAEAEGLIEFMLGDLRKKLEPVGRLDALDAVGGRALSYYDKQDPRALDADALGQRARSLMLVGEIDVRRGDMAAALKAFGRARETTAELLARAPDNPTRIYEHAQSVYWVGFYDWQHGDLPAAEEAMLEYQALVKRLVVLEPDNKDWQAEVAYSHSNLGVMLMDQARVPEALAQFEMSRQANLRRLDAAPADVMVALDLAGDYSWQSSAQERLLQLEEAVRLRREELALYRAVLQREPRNAVALERLMFADRFLASLSLARGELKDASAQVAEARRLALAQVLLEPDNVDWKMAAAKSGLIQAELDGASGRPEAGLVELARTRPMIASLLAQDPKVWAWRVELQETQAQVESDLLRAIGRPTEALRVAEASLSRLQLTAKDRKQARKVARWLGLAAGRVGRLRAETGDRSGAQSAWRIAADALTSVEAGVDAEAVAWLARARAGLGDADGAEALRQRLRKAGYRHPSFTSVPERGAVHALATGRLR